MSDVISSAPKDGAATLALRRVDELATWTKEQVDLIKATVCVGATDDELKLFLYTASKRGLDPLANQIHAMKRWSAEQGREVMKVQTAIDGLRLVAERTGVYAPGPMATYEYEVNEKTGVRKLLKATAYVKKWVKGEWHLVDADAFYSEYVQKKKDGNPNRMWSEKPHVMLAKCAEALALRRAFPQELSGLYTHDEMPDDVDPAPTRDAGPSSPLGAASGRERTSVEYREAPDFISRSMALSKSTPSPTSSLETPSDPRTPESSGAGPTGSGMGPQSESVGEVGPGELSEEEKDEIKLGEAVGLEAIERLGIDFTEKYGAQHRLTVLARSRYRRLKRSA